MVWQFFLDSLRTIQLPPQLMNQCDSAPSVNHLLAPILVPSIANSIKPVATVAGTKGGSRPKKENSTCQPLCEPATANLAIILPPDLEGGLQLYVRRTAKSILSAKNFY